MTKQTPSLPYQSPVPGMPAFTRSELETSPRTAPIRQHHFPLPKLRLQLNDLSHGGSATFLAHIKGDKDIAQQVQNVLNLLYLSNSPRPGTRSVTFILRDMPGVAYTTGIDLDDDHKEIHVSLGYIDDKPRHELLGVICHELVHCFQWNAEGTCNGGLIEGIADWVRLRAGLAATHWKQEADGNWDGGYQHTGYFLDYLEHRFGPGTVGRINALLQKGKYDEEKLFGEACKGHKVEHLWKDYGNELEKRKRQQESEQAADEDAHER